MDVNLSKLQFAGDNFIYYQEIIEDREDCPRGHKESDTT